jgi:hypothetical protein
MSIYSDAMSFVQIVGKPLAVSSGSRADLDSIPSFIAIRVAYEA